MRILFVTSQWKKPDGNHIAPFVKREVEALRFHGLEVDVFTYSGGWNLTAYLRAMRAFREKLAGQHYDLVHARFGQCGLVARAQRRVPVVITYGGSDVQGSLEFSGRQRYKSVLLQAVSRTLSLLVDEVIVVSDHLGRLLPRSDYHVIPSGIDLALFQPMGQAVARKELGLQPGQHYVLFAADPTNQQKRFSLAQAACERARRRLNLELLVLTGQPSTRVPYYMNACDVMLITSANEGSPNVVKEALACNLPIVSVNVGDVEERMGLVEGCIVCEQDTPDVLADALIAVLQRPQRLHAREQIRQLSSEVMASRVIDVYRKALAKRKAHDAWNAAHHSVEPTTTE